MEVKELAKLVAKTLGLSGYRDIYFFCARIGNHYTDFDFTFNWEPFRDLAGPLERAPDAEPVLVVAQAEPLQAPKVERREVPVPHFLLTVAKNLSAQSVANAWLETIVEAGAQHGRHVGPFDWFLEDLGLAREDLTPKARDFVVFT